MRIGAIFRRIYDLRVVERKALSKAVDNMFVLQGTPFADICELTDVPEGSIVRTIVRLDETCREFKNAARIIGDSSLFKKMEEASQAIKRDIVFAASLYVTGLSATTTSSS